MSCRIHLDDKVAIVTGASRGIGEAIARAFADNGAKVVVAARKEGALADVARSIGPSAHAVVAHTGKEDDVKNLVAETIRKFGRVDVLVNNAATNPFFGPLLDADIPSWDKTFDVNLKGYFWLTREVALHLRAREAPGAIVNVASMVALEAAPMQGVYAMTKAAVVSMTKTFAFELASSKIRVNAIAPGLVDTRFASAIVHNEALVSEALRKTPLGRYASPAEIAGAALYLASDSASFVTGHTLVVDGGMTTS
jgi:NAD(P)-dependent dehydrogenase (short-subunit alcohol dehydrogenase family)